MWTIVQSFTHMHPQARHFAHTLYIIHIRTCTHLQLLQANLAGVWLSQFSAYYKVLCMCILHTSQLLTFSLSPSLSLSLSLSPSLSLSLSPSLSQDYFGEDLPVFTQGYSTPLHLLSNLPQCCVIERPPLGNGDCLWRRWVP